VYCRSPLFAIAKLLATGLVNLNRVEVLWRPVTNHLLEVIIHLLNHLREWGIDVKLLCYLDQQFNMNILPL
ncbi:putative MON2 protein, partial [Daphnia magna]